jgi:DegV family protein with EDD domain
MKIAVLSDSSCTKSRWVNHKDFFYVPLMITKPDGSQIPDDDHFNDDDFYQELDKSALKTSLTPPGMMTEMWDKLLKEYDEIVVLLLSKGLSGQFNAARLLSMDEQYENKVHLIDTNGVSIVNDRLIEKSFELIEQGKSGAEIKTEVEGLNESFLTLIIPKSLDQLVRGGRISKAAAGLAKLLKITPILRYNGEIDKESKSRTFKKAVSDALQIIVDTIDDVKKIDITFSRTDDETMQIVKDIVADFGLEVANWSPLSNVIIAHTGRHTFAFCAWAK